jgi:hypothetical protein
MATGIAHRIPEFRAFDLLYKRAARDHGHGDCTQNTEFRVFNLLYKCAARDHGHGDCTQNT